MNGIVAQGLRDGPAIAERTRAPVRQRDEEPARKNPIRCHIRVADRQVPFGPSPLLRERGAPFSRFVLRMMERLASPLGIVEHGNENTERTLHDIDWDNLPPSTVPACQVSVRDFDNTEAANQLGEIVGAWVHAIGSFMDLANLAGVTVAINYDSALADIDQGMDGLRPLDRTDTPELQGVAKTCQVVRGGAVKSHIVFNASMLVPLIAGDACTADDRLGALGIIAHECGHVEINAKMEALVPDARLGARITDFERSVLFPIAAIIWDEYAVCRLSARFAPKQNEQHAETVISAVTGARDRANEYIKSYRLHGDLYRLLGEAGQELCMPLKAAAYLLGGMDADGLGWDNFAEARAAIETGGYGELTDSIGSGCQALWDSQQEWSAEQDVLAPLIDIVRDTFSSAGIHFIQDTAGEWQMRIPLTPETTPEV